MDDLIERKMLTGEQARTLTDAVQRGDNILISGGTGNGQNDASSTCLPTPSRSTNAS